MSMTLNERNPNVDRIHIGSQATSATVVYPGMYFRKHARIKNVYYADGAAIAKSSTNYVVAKLQDNASTPVVYASAATSDAAVVAATQYAMALKSPDLTIDAPATPAAQQEQDVPAGTMLNVSVQTLGSAATLNGCVIVEWYPL